MATLTSIMERSGGSGNVEGRLVNKGGDNTLESVYRVGVYADKKFVGSGKSCIRSYS